MKSDEIKAELVLDEIKEIIKIRSKKNVTDEGWQKIERKIFSVPELIPRLFDAYKTVTRNKVKKFKQMQKEIPEDVKSDPILELIATISIKMLEKITENDLVFYNIMESMALQQIELRKDVNRIAKMIKPTKTNKKMLSKLLKSIKDSERKGQQFAKDYSDNKPYIKQFKDFLDTEARKTTLD